MRSLYKSLILVLILSSCNSAFANIETDTITTWQLSKDSKILFRSNHFESKINTVELGLNDDFENLIVSVFHCTRTGMMDRLIKLQVENKTIAEFQDSNDSHSPFKLSKEKLIEIGKELRDIPIAIVYTDSPSEHILIGFIVFRD